MMDNKPQQGDVFETVVEAVGEKGDGVCKKDGFVIFVPGVNKGDKIKVRVTKSFCKIGFGEVVEKLESEMDDKKDSEKSATYEDQTDFIDHTKKEGTSEEIISENEINNDNNNDISESDRSEPNTIDVDDDTNNSFARGKDSQK